MINLRKASVEDAFCLFQWKNEKESLKNSINHEPVIWENHLLWLENFLKSKKRHLWILEIDHRPCGMLRLDVKEEEGWQTAEISYLVDEHYRGMGLGKELLMMAEKQAKILEISILCAQVLHHNEASKRLFEGLGYVKLDQQELYHYRKAVNVLFFRTDMNDQIATGHVMRCLSIADSGKELGKNSIFITADEQAQKVIEARGHNNIVLDTDWRKPEEEIKKLKQVIFQFGITKLLIDSYQVTERYLEKIKEETEIFYLDDLDRFSYPVQNIICYASYYRKLSYGKQEGKTGYYLGPSYLPLKKEYKERKAKVIKEKADHILLLSGGTDPCGMIERIINVLCHEEMTITVICGSLYKEFSKLGPKYEKEKTTANLHFYQNISNLEVFMEQADFAVSAGGITLYELAAMGVPTITYSFADNQLFNVEEFAGEDLMDYAGDGRQQGIEEKIYKLVKEYSSNVEKRKDRSLRMQKLVDGKGAERIAKLLM